MKTTTKAPRPAAKASRTAAPAATQAAAPKRAAASSKAPRAATTASKAPRAAQTKRSTGASASTSTPKATTRTASKRATQASEQATATQPRSRTAATASKGSRSTATASKGTAGSSIRSRAIAGRTAEAILGDIEAAFQKNASTLSGQARGAAMRGPKKLLEEARSHLEALNGQARRREAQLSKLMEEAKTARGSTEAKSRSEAIAPDAQQGIMDTAPLVDLDGGTPRPPVAVGQDAAIASSGRASSAE